MEVVINESQYKNLCEITAVKKDIPLTKLSKLEKNPIHRACYFVQSKGIKDSPWCKLKKIYDNVLTDDLKLRLEDSVMKLLTVYKKNVGKGILSKIIELTIQNENRLVNDLELIADFLTNDEFPKESVKKQLLRLKNLKDMPSSEELSDLLKMARYKENVNFEKSWEDENFQEKRTALRIDYRCNETIDDKIINLIKNIKSLATTPQGAIVQSLLSQEIDLFITNFTKCVSDSMKNISAPIKSDLELINDLYVLDENGNKVKVLDKGHYEAKNYDPFIDSYLSEFFAIFKESSLKKDRDEYIDLYNIIIQKIFEWLNQNGQEFLNNVKKHMKGLLLHDVRDKYKNIIIPIEYIDLYWSNKGQRDCSEKRISIRYKLKSKVDTDKIEAYEYNKNSDIVKRIKISDQNLGIVDSKIICP